MNSLVYFALTPCRRYIKIGYTRNLPQRLIDLRNWWRFGNRNYSWYSPDDYRIIGVIAGGFELEQTLHRQFEKYRVGRSEAFKPAPELVEYALTQTTTWKRPPAPIPLSPVQKKTLIRLWGVGSTGARYHTVSSEWHCPSPALRGLHMRGLVEAIHDGHTYRITEKGCTAIERTPFNDATNQLPLAI